MRESSNPAEAIQFCPGEVVSEENPWPDFQRHHMKRNGITSWIRDSRESPWEPIQLKYSRLEDIHCILTAHPTQGLIKHDGDAWLIAYSAHKPPARVIRAPAATRGWKTTRGPYYTIFVVLYHLGLFKLQTSHVKAATGMQRVITDEDL